MPPDSVPFLETWRPLARHEELVQSPLDDGLIVYDQRSAHIHTLNGISCAVWRACDGTRTVKAIRQEVDAGLPDDVVLLALRQLAEADLLANPLPAILNGDTSSRRTLLRRLAAAGVLPVLMSVSAPAAAQATSDCTADGSSCHPLRPCCSGYCYERENYCAPPGCLGRNAPCAFGTQC
jgi:hypothetical protein